MKILVVLKNQILIILFFKSKVVCFTTEISISVPINISKTVLAQPDLLLKGFIRAPNSNGNFRYLNQTPNEHTRWPISAFFGGKFAGFRDSLLPVS